MICALNIKFRHFLFVLSFVLIGTASYSQKVDSVIVGNGGGITGMMTVYSISPKLIKKGKGLEPISYSSTAKFKKSDFKKIASEAKVISDNNASFSYPYNTYKFIEIHSKGKSVKYTWGDPSHKAPENIESLYNKIIAFTNSYKLK